MKVYTFNTFEIEVFDFYQNFLTYRGITIIIFFTIIKISIFFKEVQINLLGYISKL